MDYREQQIFPSWIALLTRLIGWSLSVLAYTLPSTYSNLHPLSKSSWFISKKGVYKCIIFNKRPCHSRSTSSWLYFVLQINNPRPIKSIIWISKFLVSLYGQIWHWYWNIPAIPDAEDINNLSMLNWEAELADNEIVKHLTRPDRSGGAAWGSDKITISTIRTRIGKFQ